MLIPEEFGILPKAVRPPGESGALRVRYGLEFLGMPWVGKSFQGEETAFRRVKNRLHGVCMFGETTNRTKSGVPTSRI